MSYLSDIPTKRIEEGNQLERPSTDLNAGEFVGKKHIEIATDSPIFIEQCTAITRQIFEITDEDDDLYELVSNSISFETVNTDIENMRVAVFKVSIRVRETGVVNDFAVKIQAVPMILFGTRLRTPLTREAEETRQFLTEAGSNDICLGPVVSSLTADGSNNGRVHSLTNGIVIEAYATSWRGDWTIRNLLPYLHANTDFGYTSTVFLEMVEGLIFELANYEQVGRVHRDLKTDNVTFNFAGLADPSSIVSDIRFIDLGSVVRTGGDIGEPYMGETPKVYRPSEAIVGEHTEGRENIQPSYDLTGAAQILIEVMMSMGVYLPPTISELKELGFENPAISALVLKSFSLLTHLNYAPLVMISPTESEDMIRQGVVGRHEYRYYFEQLAVRNAYFLPNFELLSGLSRKYLQSFIKIRNVLLQTHGSHESKPDDLEEFASMLTGALWEV